MSKPKFLIQSATGDVYHYSPQLEGRGDMFAYDEKTMGKIVNGRAAGVEKAKAEAAKEEAAKVEVKVEEAKADEPKADKK